MSKKITQMKNADTLTGIEFMEVAQSGKSRKIRVNNIIELIDKKEIPISQIAASATNYTDIKITSVSAASREQDRKQITIQEDLRTFEISADTIFDDLTYELRTLESSASDRFHTVETSAAYVNRVYVDQKAPIGFVGDVEQNSVLTRTFTNATRTFEIAPVGDAFSFYVRSQKFTKTEADSIVISDVEGIHFIYYDIHGELQEQVTSDIDLNFLYIQSCVVAYVYWDKTNQKQIILGRENHRAIMPGVVHLYLHETRGSVLESGGALGNLSVDQPGSSNSDCQFAVEKTVLWDEDLRHILEAKGLTDTVNVYYRVGADSLNQWRIDESSNFPCLVSPSGSGRAVYNEMTGSNNWKRTELVSGHFVLAHVFAFNDLDRKFGVIMGQNEYVTITEARLGALDELVTINFQGTAAQERKYLGTLVIQSSDSYTNDVHSRLRSPATGEDYVDLREATFPGGGSSATVVDHGSLSGLTDQDHPASAIYTYVSGFGGILDSGDTDVQKALDAIDDHIHDRISDGTTNNRALVRSIDNSFTVSAGGNLVISAGMPGVNFYEYGNTIKFFGHTPSHFDQTFSTFRFTSYSTHTNVTNPSNAIDGSTSSYATVNNNGILRLDENNSAGSGTINSVFIRCYKRDFNYTTSTMTPYFNGNAGSAISTVGEPEATAWTQWFDITNDTNAPGSGNWTWADVENLDVEFYRYYGGGAPMYVYEAEILVNYDETIPAQTYTFQKFNSRDGGSVTSLYQNNIASRTREGGLFLFNPVGKKSSIFTNSSGQAMVSAGEIVLKARGSRLQSNFGFNRNYKNEVGGSKVIISAGHLELDFHNQTDTHILSGGYGLQYFSIDPAGTIESRFNLGIPIDVNHLDKKSPHSIQSTYFRMFGGTTSSPIIQMYLSQDNIHEYPNNRYGGTNELQYYSFRVMHETPGSTQHSNFAFSWNNTWLWIYDPAYNDIYFNQRDGISIGNGGVNSSQWQRMGRIFTGNEIANKDDLVISSIKTIHLSAGSYDVWVDDYFNESYWQVIGGSWSEYLSGQFGWHSDGFGMLWLEVNGSWFKNYRPTKMRLNFWGLSGSVDVILIDSNSDEIANVSGITANDEIDITFGIFNIAELKIQAGDLNWYLTSIEFFNGTKNVKQEIDTVKDAFNVFTTDGKALGVSGSQIEIYRPLYCDEIYVNDVSTSFFIGRSPLTTNDLVIASTNNIWLSGGNVGEVLRSDSVSGAWIFNSDILPETAGLDIGKNESANRWANVWADLVNGADLGLNNGWRLLESEKYDGYPVGFAIGNQGFIEGEISERAEGKPIFVVTEDFIEYKGIKITKEKLEKLLELI